MGIGIGLNICEDIHIELGDTLIDVKEHLDKSSIKYDIPCIDAASTGGKEVDVNAKKLEATTIFLKQYSVEVGLIGDSVKYIRSTVNTTGKCLDTRGMGAVEIIHAIREYAGKHLEIETCNIKVDRFNNRTLSTILIVNSGSNHIKISIQSDKNYELFISGIELQ